MWYEIIPCLGIITTALTLPSIFGYYVQKFSQNGNPYKRDLSLPFYQHMLRRDQRLTGDTYVQQGLDAIPDN